MRVQFNPLGTAVEWFREDRQAFVRLFIKRVSLLNGLVHLCIFRQSPISMVQAMRRSQAAKTKTQLQIIQHPQRNSSFTRVRLFSFEWTFRVISRQTIAVQEVFVATASWSRGIFCRCVPNVLIISRQSPRINSRTQRAAKPCVSGKRSNKPLSHFLDLHQFVSVTKFGLEISNLSHFISPFFSLNVLRGKE